MKGIVMTIIGFAIAIALVVSIIIPLSNTTKNRGDLTKGQLTGITTDITSLSNPTATTTP